MSYPDYFPKGCPPRKAKNVEIEAYRICKDEIVTHSDFLSFHEEGKLAYLDDIKKYGVSLDKDEDTLKAMLKMPSFKKQNKKCIAKGITKKDLGVVLETPSASSTHLTWWLKVDSKPEKYFQCCYKKGE